MWLPDAAVARAGPRAAVDRVELLEAAAGTDGDTRERGLGEVHRHVRLVTQTLVQPLQQRAAACEHDSTVHDVGSKLGRRLVERRLDGVDDLVDRLLERVPHFLTRQ